MIKSSFDKWYADMIDYNCVFRESIYDDGWSSLQEMMYSDKLSCVNETPSCVRLSNMYISAIITKMSKKSLVCISDVRVDLGIL